LALALALPSLDARFAFADGAVQNQISVYSGPNAVGYLQPLTNAFGAALNSAFGYSAYIPTSSFHLSIEAPVMGVYFEDTDRTFRAATEAGFQPSQHVTAPTVAGSGHAVTVTGAGGVSYSFPGGLDLNSFALVVPQLRMGSVAGTVVEHRVRNARCRRVFRVRGPGYRRRLCIRDEPDGPVPVQRSAGTGATAGVVPRRARGARATLISASCRASRPASPPC
jgi:hypothetical protein